MSTTTNTVNNAVLIATSSAQEQQEFATGKRVAVSVLAADVPLLEAAPLLLKVCQAVLLFHKGGSWTSQDQQTWDSLLAPVEATTKNLCDFARAAIAKAQGKPVPR